MTEFEKLVKTMRYSQKIVAKGLPNHTEDVRIAKKYESLVDKYIKDKEELEFAKKEKRLF